MSEYSAASGYHNLSAVGPLIGSRSHIKP